jgi:hypothetical protein
MWWSSLAWDLPKPDVLIDALVKLFLDDLVAEPDALVADVHARTCDRLPDLLLRLAAEAAHQLTFLITESEHAPSLLDSLRQRTLAGPQLPPKLI